MPNPIPTMPDEPTLYTLITTDPAGCDVVTFNHTLAGAWSLMTTLRNRGYGPVFNFVSEQPAPVPDAMLCPCAQPATVNRGA